MLCLNYGILCDCLKSVNLTRHLLCSGGVNMNENNFRLAFLSCSVMWISQSVFSCHGITENCFKPLRCFFWNVLEVAFIVGISFFFLPKYI